MTYTNDTSYTHDTYVISTPPYRNHSRIRGPASNVTANGQKKEKWGIKCDCQRPKKIKNANEKCDIKCECQRPKKKNNKNQLDTELTVENNCSADLWEEMLSHTVLFFLNKVCLFFWTVVNKYSPAAHLREHLFMWKYAAAPQLWLASMFEN